MNIIKRHKGLALVLGLTFILVIILLIIFSKMIFLSGDTVYGNRLDDIVNVDKKVTNKVIENLEELEQVESAEIRIQGKILYTTIFFKSGTKLDKAKEIASNTLSEYDESVIKCYDFGFFLKEMVEDNKETEEVENGFIVAGTKHPKVEIVSWTKK